MSISGISGTNPYANIFFDTAAQNRVATLVNGQGSSDTISFSPEAMEMLQASKIEQPASIETSMDSGQENGHDTSLHDKTFAEEGLTEQALAGGMKGGKRKESSDSSDEDDDTDSTLTEDWYETSLREIDPDDDFFTKFSTEIQ